MIPAYSASMLDSTICSNPLCPIIIIPAYSANAEDKWFLFISFYCTWNKYGYIFVFILVVPTIHDRSFWFWVGTHKASPSLPPPPNLRHKRVFLYIVYAKYTV